MILITPEHLKTIADAAEAAFPAECCGLLVGRGALPRRLTVTRVIPAANLLAEAGCDRFELDPRARFEAMRQCEGTAERIIGHYHSHPDGSAHPSPTDLACAHEPDLAWIIAGVAHGQMIQTQAWRLDPRRRAFRQISIRTPKKVLALPRVIP